MPRREAEEASTEFNMLAHKNCRTQARRACTVLHAHAMTSDCLRSLQRTNHLRLRWEERISRHSCEMTCTKLRSLQIDASEPGRYG